MNLFRTTLLVTAGLITGCASVSAPLDGNYSEAFYPKQATDQSIGANVRWGGTVIKTMPEADQTCIEILAQPLDQRARPEHSDDDLGRFLACRNEFIDPEIYVNSRNVTVVGEISSFRNDNVGDYSYTYPVVNADAVVLWPERLDTAYYGYGHGYYGHGFGHRSFYRFPFYYGGFRSRFYRPYYY